MMIKMTIKRMLLLTIIGVALASGCEKTELPGNEKEQPEEGKTWWDDEIVPDTVCNGFMTVAEASQAEVGTLINVRGYIVGSTSRNIYNIIVGPPFESRSSLVLADMRLTEVDGFYEDDLFPVCLTDFNDTQRALNLVDHPEHWNKQIYIFGIKSSYLGMPGLKKIMKYEFAE